MAALTETQRAAVWADLMRRISDERQITGLRKTDLRAAVDAADAWADANSASFNTALPAAARTGLTAAQKALLLMFVIEKRYGAGV